MERLTFTYGRHRSRALNDITCEFRSNQVAVLGPNGAGKSTLLRILASVVPPTDGSFDLNGHHVPAEKDALLEYRSALGYVPQSLRIFDSYRCDEFLRYVCWLRDVPVRLSESRVDRALEAVSMTDLRYNKVGTLSEGLRRRLALAQGLVNEPQILILDEPTVGLDPEQRVEYRNLLADIAQQTVIVMATHLIEDVAAIAADLLILAQGRKVYAGSISDFCGYRDDSFPISPKDVEAQYLKLMGSQAIS